MQKRMHSREFKLELIRQIATGQKRPAQACREYGLADVCFPDGAKNIKSVVKQHLGQQTKKGQRHRNSALRNSNNFAGNWPWRIRC